MSKFASFFALGDQNNNGNNKNRNGAQRDGGKAPRKRKLTLESLESRELLSATIGDVDLFETHSVAKYTPGTEEPTPVILAAAPSNANAADLAVYNNLVSRGFTDGASGFYEWNADGRLTEIYVNGIGSKLLTGSLDVSGLVALETLSCSSNELTSINISGCSALMRLFCDNNRLTTLNVSSLQNLRSLECYSNKLTSLNVSGCATLRHMLCHQNNLTQLNLNATPLSAFEAATRMDARDYSLYNYPSGAELTVDKTVTLVQPPAANVPTVSTNMNFATYVQGETATPLKVTATGNGVLSYQWYYRDESLQFITIAGATSATYTPQTAILGLRAYGCEVTNTSGITFQRATCPETQVTVKAAVDFTPVITTQPQSATYTQGQTATPLSVAATGIGSATTYQWYSTITVKGSVVSAIILEATSATYTPPTTSVGQDKYRCRVTTTVGSQSYSAYSDWAIITVNAAPDSPVITAQPQSATYAQNATATPLSVTATGNGTLTYQWYLITESVSGRGTKRATIIGATSATFTPSTATVGEYVYECVVKNTVNGKTLTTTSDTVTISVVPVADTPVITSQPTSISCTQGKAATLSIEATGNGTLTYQWYRLIDGGGGFKAKVAITGATSATYTPPTENTGTNDYVCTVKNTSGGTTKTKDSDEVTVTVTVAPPADTPVISVQPKSATYTQGETPTPLSVEATGNGTLTYQWYRVILSGGLTGLRVAARGETSATYIPPTSAVNERVYMCVVTNTSGGTEETIESEMVTITVTAALPADKPVITSQPTSIGCTPGKIATLSIEASGNGVLTYQWYYRDGASTIIIVGATEDTYTPPTTTIGECAYLCIVTNTSTSGDTAEETESIVVFVTVFAPLAETPVITAQPLSTTYTKDQIATPLSVTATVYNGTLTYQWYYWDGPSTKLIAGATDETYTPPTTAVGTVYYLCVVTNTFSGTTESTASTEAVITVTAATLTVGTPVISVQPESKTYIMGQTATALFVTATASNGTLSYQWYKGGVEIHGATSASYTPSTEATASYYCIVTNTLDTQTKAVQSGTATITVTTENAPTTPTISVHPQSATYTKGQTATALSVTATADKGTLSYQWYKDGAEMSGATSATYTPSTEATASYYCVVTSTLNGVTKTAQSNAALITIPAPTLTAPASFTSTAQTSASVSLSWAPQSGLTGYKLEYRKVSNANWTVSTAPAADATSATVTGLTMNTEYEFRLTAINADGTAASTTKKSTTIPEAIPGAKVAKASGVKKVVSLTAITLTWKQNTAKNTHYTVSCATPGVEISDITIVGGKHSVTITGLKPGIKYNFEIVAYNGETAAKPTKVGVKTKAYAAVSGVKKTVSGQNVTWKWTDKFAAETTHYELLDASGGIMKTVTAAEVTVEDLVPGTHKFSIRAVIKDASDVTLFASKEKKVSIKIK